MDKISQLSKDRLYRPITVSFVSNVLPLRSPSKTAVQQKESTPATVKPLPSNIHHFCQESTYNNTNRDDVLIIKVCDVFNVLNETPL